MSDAELSEIGFTQTERDQFHESSATFRLESSLRYVLLHNMKIYISFTSVHSSLVL
jgi:hypothetical protein